MINFSEKFQFLRKHFGVTTAGLEKILKLSNGYIANIEKKGIDNPGKLLLALNGQGVSIDWFLTSEGAPFLTAGAVSAQTQEQDAGENPASLPLPNAPKVPLLRQKISCGEGVSWDDEQNIVDYIDVFSLPHLNVKRLFALCVDGSSMLGAGIYNGDYVLFDGSYDQTPKDGIYVFALDGDVFCKRLEFDKISKKINVFSVRFADLDKAELVTTIDTQDASTPDRLTIFGRVLYWIHPNSDDR